MSGTGYDKAQNQRTYRFPAAAIAAAGVLGRVIGPAGRRGRVIGAEYVVTTGITGAASAITVDTNAGLTGPFTFDAEVAGVNSGGVASAAELKAGAELPADTVIEVQTDGGASAGAADLVITIQWY